MEQRKKEDGKKFQKISPVAAHSHSEHKIIPKPKIRMNVVQLMQEKWSAFDVFLSIILQQQLYF